MNRIGPILKEAREKRSVTLDDVHAKIKIHPRVLQLLEEEKFDKLPSPMFVKSFLRSYADFLEVNSEELVQAYEKSKTGVVEPEQVLFIKPKDPAGETRISPAKWAAGIAAAAILLFVLSGVPSKMVSGWTVKMKEAQTARAAQKKKEAAAKPVKVKDEPAAAAEETVSDWLNTPKMGNFPTLNKRQPLEMEIKALDAVWIHITADGQVIFQGILKKGAREAWKAKQTLEIWTGNASNMTVTLNKSSLGSPGKGVVKKMVITHEGIRIASPLAQ